MSLIDTRGLERVLIFFINILVTISSLPYSIAGNVSSSPPPPTTKRITAERINKVQYKYLCVRVDHRL